MGLMSTEGETFQTLNSSVSGGVALASGLADCARPPSWGHQPGHLRQWNCRARSDCAYSVDPSGDASGTTLLRLLGRGGDGLVHPGPHSGGGGERDNCTLLVESQGTKLLSVLETSYLGLWVKHVETLRSAALPTFPSSAVSSSPSPAAMPVQSTPYGALKASAVALGLGSQQQSCGSAGSQK